MNDEIQELRERMVQLFELQKMQTDLSRILMDKVEELTAAQLITNKNMEVLSADMQTARENFTRIQDKWNKRH